MSNTKEPQPSTSTTEEYLREITIGERRPLNSTIQLAPYNPEWPLMYAAEAKRIHDALGSSVLLLEHVGSTSVPGLAAKPIIDMVMAVEDSALEAAYVPALEAAGYTLRLREPDLYEHRMLIPPDVSGHLHVHSAGCVEISRMIAFRDWLRSHPEDRLAYENTKRRLAAQTWKYGQHYADAKTKIVQAILARAGENAS